MTNYTAIHPKYGTYNILAGSDRQAMDKYVSLVREALEAEHGKPGHHIDIQVIASETGKTELWAEIGYSRESRLRSRLTLKYTVRKSATLDHGAIAISDPDAPATGKQLAMIRKLATRIGGGSIAARTDLALAGNLTKGEASRLIDDMLTEH